METQNETISKLKLIGRISNGDKLNVKGLFIQKDNFFTKLSRWFYYTDNRHNTVNFVRTVIYNTFTIINTLSKSSKSYDNLILLNVIEDLEGAKSGILNLMKTYEDDIKMNCDLLCLIESITVELTKYRHEESVDLTHPDIIQNHGVPVSQMTVNPNAVHTNSSQNSTQNFVNNNNTFK